MNAKLDFDATKLSEALKYQIHVAINYCHTLEKHDVLWIEVFGDVTVEGRDQVEVKDYSDSLTDGHENFWNTLNNWLKPDFYHQQYANLVLLTTQEFGERASLKDWERLDPGERLAALETIHEAAEARFEKAKQSKDDDDKREPNDEGVVDGGHERKSAAPSKVLKLQRKVLAIDTRESLLEALPKIKIVTEQPDLLGLISAYKTHYLKGIQPHRMDSFLDDLFGFMTSALKITGGWRFTAAEFDKKFAELTARYLIGTLKFPRLNSDDVEMEAAEMNVHDRLFAMKLDEIGGEEFILQATADLLHAQQYIAELVKDCTTSQTDIEDYKRNQLRMHRSSRSSVMGKCDSTLTHAQLQTASRAFYDERCGESADRFSTYDFTPIEFRNGIYHMLADEEPRERLI
ncbi:hypothetical protein KAF44_40145 [Cupriavidus necator]|nr:hypothetical protein KAF44_40145 [Cupriavidus necator]